MNLKFTDPIVTIHVYGTIVFLVSWYLCYFIYGIVSFISAASDCYVCGDFFNDVFFSREALSLFAPALIFEVITKQKMRLLLLWGVRSLFDFNVGLVCFCAL